MCWEFLPHFRRLARCASNRAALRDRHSRNMPPRRRGYLSRSFSCSTKGVLAPTRQSALSGEHNRPQSHGGCDINEILDLAYLRQSICSDAISLSVNVMHAVFNSLFAPSESTKLWWHRVRYQAKVSVDRRYRRIDHDAPIMIGRGVSIPPACTIGGWTYVQPYAYIGFRSKMGRYCSIGRMADISPVHHDLSLFTTHEFATKRTRFRFDPRYAVEASSLVTKHSKSPTRKPVELGADVWVGNKAIILTGVKVGHGAVVGAGAVVTRDVPPYAIVVGMPAKIIGYRYSAEIIQQLLASQWWEKNPDELCADDFAFLNRNQAAKRPD